jgi:hypothetical protein
MLISPDIVAPILQGIGIKFCRLVKKSAEQRCSPVSLGGNPLRSSKHRMKGGIHAAHNNTLHAGTTMVTGHLHSVKVTPFSDYNGTRWDVDTGTPKAAIAAVLPCKKRRRVHHARSASESLILSFSLTE